MPHILSELPGDALIHALTNNGKTLDFKFGSLGLADNNISDDDLPRLTTSLSGGLKKTTGLPSIFATTTFGSEIVFPIIIFVPLGARILPSPSALLTVLSPSPRL